MSESETCLPENKNSVFWRKKERKKNQLNKNNDMNDTWILPGHVRAKTRGETFN